MAEPVQRVLLIGITFPLLPHAHLRLEDATLVRTRRAKNRCRSSFKWVQGIQSNWREALSFPGRVLNVSFVTKTHQCVCCFCAGTNLSLPSFSEPLINRGLLLKLSATLRALSISASAPLLSILSVLFASTHWARRVLGFVGPTT